MTELQDCRRESELLGRQNLRGNHSKNGARAFAVHERIPAEPREAGDLVREVSIVPLAELRAVGLRHDRRQQLDEHLRAQRRGGWIERLHVAVLADDWW